nr:reverse transcriptase domain-containing protein [Tanacetum cinerariifolium]
MDDEPMWAADRVVAPNLGSAITIPETANEFSIKGNRLTLVKGSQFDGRIKTDPQKNIHEFLGICYMFKYRNTKNEDVRLMIFPLSLTAFADEGSSNYDTDKIVARIDAMTMKMDARIGVIDEILEEDLMLLSMKVVKSFTSSRELLSKEKIFAEFDEFMAMTIEENCNSDSDKEEPPFEKITFNTDYKIKKSLEEPSTYLELKPLLKNLKYVFLEESSLLPVIISSQLSKQNKDKLEKCHFMVKEGIVLRYKVSGAGLEVDKAKIDVISKLSPPTNVKGIRSFLGHAGFYRRFIKDFLKITHPLIKLLEKDTLFEFNEECHKAFILLKEKLTCTPVIVSLNWNLPFVLMCDASEFAVRAVLG